MGSKQRILLLLVALLFLFVLAACQEQEPVEVTRVVEVPVESEPVEVTRVVEVMVEPDVEEGMEQTAVSEVEVPFLEAWMTSGHADVDAEAFRHWDEEDPAEIPEDCAKCHSTYGYHDFLGLDGSEAGVVSTPAEIGSTVECVACHNDAIAAKTSVIFPSGIEITGLGAEARCMECHQGRASTQTVNMGIEEAGLAEEADLDTISEEIHFTNIHYNAAAATQLGTQAQGGYEYAGKSYDSRFDHVAPYDSCVDCHDTHTGEVRFEDCTDCHTKLKGPEDLVDIRSQGSLVDYNGNGDMDEGMFYEIEGLAEMLYTAMQAYGADVAGTPIVYDSHAYPYFFIDSDANGELDEGEAIYPNAYNAWSPRLAKAAYNYQVSQKDPGLYAHGGKYIIQLLYDSIEDLNMAIDEPIDLSTARRIDHGHFAGSEEAFRHWDGEEDGGIVPASCSKCHSADGLPFFLEEGVNISHSASNGLNCATCHTDFEEYGVYKVETVEFPSGAKLGFEDNIESNICLSCHQGRQSTVSVNNSIGDKPAGEVSEELGFQNVHYFAAGATLFGTEAMGAYEYDGQEYVGRKLHVEKFDTCTECHSTHKLEVKVEDCSTCHEDVETAANLKDIRFNEEEVYVDYDGDGDIEEGISGEIETMHAALYAAIQAYAADVAGTPIIYDSHAYPYFFIDSDGNGEVNGGEAIFPNQYNTWTPDLLRAAYNYQYTAKDPGAYSHNADYIMQVLYDSIEVVGGDTAGLTRP